MELTERPRRLRSTPALRKMVRETRIDKSSLIYPMFVKEGKGLKEEIPTMPGQFRYSVDMLPAALDEVSAGGVLSVMLFGIPDKKDECGTGAWMEDGIIQKALKEAKRTHPEIYFISDVCMCEYTSHGHCGILDVYKRQELWCSDAWESPFSILMQERGADGEKYAEHFTSRQGDEAVNYLFELACGMHSQIFGEDQILTQIREALGRSRECGCADSVLETLFRSAVTAAKQVKTEVRLTARDMSIPEGAAALLEDRYGPCLLYTSSW